MLSSTHTIDRKRDWCYDCMDTYGTESGVRRMAIKNLGLEVRILSNLIYNKLNQLTMETEGVSVHQCWILQYLTENQDKEVYQKDIEQLFSIKRATANQMLRSLEAKGYIRRTLSADDARRNILTVTKDGAEACAHLAGNLYQFMLKLHGDIPREELEQFQTTLRKLWHNIE